MRHWIIMLVGGALLCGVFGCAGDAENVVYPARPERVEPAEVFDYSQRKMLQAFSKEKFQTIYAGRGKPAFMVLVNRELRDDNPAELKLRALLGVSIRGRTDKGDKGTVTEDRTGEIQVRGRDESVVKTIDRARIESGLVGVLLDNGVAVMSLDTLRARAADEKAKPFKIADHVQVAVLVKASPDTTGAFGYSLQVVDLKKGSLYVTEARVIPADAVAGRVRTLEGFFRRVGLRMLGALTERWDSSAGS